MVVFRRGECTDTLRRRITELETECKKLSMDIKLKEDQIRELEMKVQVSLSDRSNTGPISINSTSSVVPTFMNNPTQHNAILTNVFFFLSFVFLVYVGNP